LLAGVSHAELYVIDEGYVLQVEEQASLKSRCIVHKPLSKTLLRRIKEKVLVRTYGEIPAKKSGV
jgi:hypothetical protein